MDKRLPGIVPAPRRRAGSADAACSSGPSAVVSRSSSWHGPRWCCAAVSPTQRGLAASTTTQQRRSSDRPRPEGPRPLGCLWWWWWRRRRLGGREPALSRGHRSDKYRRVRRRRRHRGCSRVLQGQPGQEQRAHQQQHPGHWDVGLVPAVVAAGVLEQPHPDTQVTGGQQREQHGPDAATAAGPVTSFFVVGQEGRRGRREERSPIVNCPDRPCAVRRRSLMRRAARPERKRRPSAPADPKAGGGEVSGGEGW